MIDLIITTKYYRGNSQIAVTNYESGHCLQRLASVVLVHGVFVLVQGVFVLVHGVLGLRSSFLGLRFRNTRDLGILRAVTALAINIRSP